MKPMSSNPAVKELHVSLQWDSEAQVWIATSDDIPCLVLEEESCDALMKRVALATPELLELNHKPMDNYRLVFHSKELAPVHG